MVRQKRDRILQVHRRRKFRRSYGTFRRWKKPNNCQTSTTFPYYCVSRDRGRRQSELHGICKTAR